MLNELTGVGVNSGALKLSRIKLSRDVYFRSVDEMSRQFFRQQPNVKPLTKVTLGQEQYFLLGDNSPSSWDSRISGPIEGSRISGTAASIWWPTSRSRRLN